MEVKPGETVKAGQALAVMSAMKMETTVGATCDGVVSHVAVIKGDIIDGGDLVVRIKADDAGAAANGSTPEAEESKTAAAAA